MALDVVAASRIERPPDAVAAYGFDPANDPHWIGGVREVERLTSGALAVGSRVRRLGSFLGRRDVEEVRGVERDGVIRHERGSVHRAHDRETGRGAHR